MCICDINTNYYLFINLFNTEVVYFNLDVNSSSFSQNSFIKQLNNTM